VECETRPVRIHPLGCACDDTLCEYSRIRDDYEIACLTEPPPSPPPPLACELLAKDKQVPCPPCPDSPWVVLAVVKLPDKPETPVAPADIDITVRRVLFSTAILQEQLIACCCQQPVKLLADLAISQDKGQDAEQTIIVLVVRNIGPALAHNVVVRDVHPAGGMVLPGGFSAAQGAWTVKAGPELRAELGDLAPGAVVQLRFSMRSPRGKNIATVSSETDDPNLANNESTVAF
jgi:uncharacterized repeat protein (TIGR01451 family)